MRKIKIIEHISLDGIIQAGSDNDGGFAAGDWSAPYRSPAGLAMVLSEWGERFDLLIGRRTYDMWSEFWPTAPKSPMGDRLNAATKYVVTHRPESLKWGPFEDIGADVNESVRSLKANEGPNLIVAGSSSLTSILLEHELADEMLLLVNPVLLGKGKRFFAEGTPPRAFELVSSRTSPTGIVVNHYMAAGTLQNFVRPETSFTEYTGDILYTFPIWRKSNGLEGVQQDGREAEVYCEVLGGRKTCPIVSRIWDHEADGL